MNSTRTHLTHLLFALLLLIGVVMAPAATAALAEDPAEGSGTETGYDWSDHADACARGYSWSNGRACP